MENKNSMSKVIVVTAIISILVCIPLGIFVGKTLFESKSKEKEIVENNKNETPEKETEEDDKKQPETLSCEGLRNAVYEGEYHETTGQIQLHEYFSLTLNSDGTFIAVWKNSEGYNGTYTIQNNVLTTEYKSLTLGETEAKYNKKTYNISSDCSTIYWSDRYNIYLK